MRKAEYKEVMRTIGRANKYGIYESSRHWLAPDKATLELCLIKLKKMRGK